MNRMDDRFGLLVGSVVQLNRCDSVKIVETRDSVQFGEPDRFNTQRVFQSLKQT